MGASGRHTMMGARQRTELARRGENEEHRYDDRDAQRQQTRGGLLAAIELAAVLDPIARRHGHARPDGVLHILDDAAQIAASAVGRYHDCGLDAFPADEIRAAVFADGVPVTADADEGRPSNSSRQNTVVAFTNNVCP